MSVVGIDYGNLSLLIAQAAKGGVDVILNDASMRQTATCVSIQGKQRFIGDAGAALARSNIQNTVSCMKLLVGRKFDEPDVQRELSKAPFRYRKLENGGVGIIVTYNDEEIVVPAEHFMAMMLVKAKEIACKANNNVNIGDAVLAVPFWFTQQQRIGILNACEIADLNCMKVVNESTSVAVSYGIYKSAKKLFSETEPVHIMFVDIGYSCYAVTIAAFVQEKLQIKSTVCDRELGGRDFDDVIIEFLTETFQKKTGLNVRGNTKAYLKMQAAAEKAKKTLSPAGVNEVNISVECLANDIDLTCLLTKDEFEARSLQLINRLAAPLNQCLSEANLTKEQIAEVEIVGGSSRINAIKRTIGQVMGLDASLVNFGLKTTMNSDEAVARGAVLQCAMISSRIKVKPFSIIEKIPYDISIQYDAEAGGAGGAEEKGDGKNNDEEEEEEGGPGDSSTGSSSNTVDGKVEATLFARGEDVPRAAKRITFVNKKGPFTVSLQYAPSSYHLLPPGTNPHISTTTIKIPPEKVTPGMKVRLTFNIDKNFCAVLASASVLELLPPSEAKEGEPVKNRYRKSDVPVETTVIGLTKEQLKAAILQESLMQSEDNMIKETAHKRNDLESYILTMRDKLDGALKSYGTNSEKMQLQTLLTAAEDWLYGDGYDTTKLAYSKKLDELKSYGNKLESRYFEEQNRSQASDSLKRQVELCRNFVASVDTSNSHITPEEKKKIKDEANNAEEWLFDELDKQSQLNSYQDPVLTVDAISKKRQQLFSTSNPIMSKPKPKPAAPAPAAGPESKTNDEKKDSNDADEKKEDGKEDESDDSKKNASNKDNSSPMEQDNNDDNNNLPSSTSEPMESC